MILNAPKTKKGILLGTMLLASIITFDYFNSQSFDYSQKENSTKIGGTFLGTGRVVKETPCVEGYKVVQTEYKLLWIFTVGTPTSEKVPC